MFLIMDKNKNKAVLPLLLPLVCTVWFLLCLTSCHEDPPPNIGIELKRDSLVRTWVIDRFIRNDEDLTASLGGTQLDFSESGRLNIIRGSSEFEGLWSLRGSSIALSVDVDDVEIRPLSGVYVATTFTDTELNLINQNARTPSVLDLSEIEQ